tara:strand:+ start:537 stop:1238 length:702 start_codon:yes stop_codon:yes gene_type:complete
MSGIIINPYIYAEESFSNTYSMAFDGVDDYQSLASSVNLGTENTLSWWIYRNSYLTQEVPFGNTASSVIGIEVYMNGVNLYKRDGSGWTIFGAILSSALTNQKWCNIVITRNGASSTAYINGNATITTVTVTDSTASNAVDTIGASSAPGYYVNGNLDETAGWNVEKSAAEVLAIYNSGTPGDLASTSPLFWYRQGEKATWSGSAWVLPDQGSSGVVATSVNMTESDREEDTP